MTTENMNVDSTSAIPHNSTISNKPADVLGIAKIADYLGSAQISDEELRGHISMISKEKELLARKYKSLVRKKKALAHENKQLNNTIELQAISNNRLTKTTEETTTLLNSCVKQLIGDLGLLVVKNPGVEVSHLESGVELEGTGSTPSSNRQPDPMDLTETTPPDQPKSKPKEMDRSIAQEFIDCEYIPDDNALISYEDLNDSMIKYVNTHYPHIECKWGKQGGRWLKPIIGKKLGREVTITTVSKRRMYPGRLRNYTSPSGVTTNTPPVKRLTRRRQPPKDDIVKKFEGFLAERYILDDGGEIKFTELNADRQRYFDVHHSEVKIGGTHGGRYLKAAIRNLTGHAANVNEKANPFVYLGIRPKVVVP